MKTAGLPWIRLDTNVHTHPKVFALADYGDKGLAAAFVYIASLAYCGANGTDGTIPRRALPFLHGTPKHAKLLVEVTLWDPTDTGWAVHNYGNRNVVGAVQQLISEALSEAGKKGAAARWHGSDPAAANGHPIMRSAHEPNGPATAEANGRRNATYGTERNERPPRLKPVRPEPQRAREKRAEARREIDDLNQTRNPGGVA